ncbi:MAG: hypothetical protein IJS00_07530 [Paludibacteraceae bacterium]|nr:hypothetical protein [Paludibacteraceae bacterium]
MKKTFTLLIAFLTLTVSAWATTTWDQTTIQSIDVDRVGTPTQTVDGIIVSATAPDDSECWFGMSVITVKDNGVLTFAPASGQLTNVVISCSGYVDVAHLVGLNSEWTYDDGTKELSWSGSAASVALECDGSSDGIYLGDIYSIDFTVVSGPAPSSITWNAGNGLEDIYLIEHETNNYQYHSGSTSATIGNITATISATTNPSVAEFKTDGNTNITLTGNATLTFSIASGQFQRIVINTNNGNGYKNSPYNDWSWSNNTLTWEGALPTNTVVLADASVDNITSIVFTLDGAAPASGGTITWGSRQANHVSLSYISNGESQTSSVIKDIITSLEKTDDGDYCEFSGGVIRISDCGELTFQSIVGDLTGIVISCSYVENAGNLSADWTYDSEAGTLTWDGTAAEQVTLSADIYCFISSIEFTYTPASAPRLGETFSGS